MAAITTNRAVEDAAIAWVIAVEQQEGREAADTRGSGAPGDLLSGERVIEVKAFGRLARGTDLWLEKRQAEEAERNPNFWLYVVENVRQGDPSLFRLARLGGERLRRLLERKKEQITYSVPWPVADYDQDPPATFGSVEVRVWAGEAFTLAGTLDPRRGPDGMPVEELPQERFVNARGLPLNAHGAGPFCSFDPPPLPASPGGYAITVDDEVVYVGITDNLLRRFGPVGYSRIQPANCYQGGQSTNCKINAGILRAAQAGHAIRLWVREGDDAHRIERDLIAALEPPWNGTR